MGVGRRPGRLEDLNDRCIGHLEKITKLKTNNDCRILFQNMGTLKIGADTDETEDSLGVLRDLEVDVRGLTEINKNYSHLLVKRSYDKMFRNKLTGADIVVSENKECAM